MDLASFRIAYPELVTADDSLVTAKLADAARNVDATMFGDRFDQAQGLLAAHYVCLSPGGVVARLDPKTLAAMGATQGYELTTYGLQFRELRDAAVTAVRAF